MRIGFIIPTDLESENLSPESTHITCAGYGAGKASACSAAAELIFEKHCDTILIWGLGGALEEALRPGDILIGTHVAYKDYNIHPLCNSTGVGFVPGFAEDLWHPLDEKLCDDLYEAVRTLFPESNVLRGNICTGDQFVLHQSRAEYNRIEQKALAVDMESAAVAQFCANLKKNVKFGVIRVISDSANSNADMDFSSFLRKFAEMNQALPRLRAMLEEMDPDNTCNTLPCDEKDVWKILKDRSCFERYCHSLYDRLYQSGNAGNITKIAGIESRGCFFAQELAGMLSIPFVPVRRCRETGSWEVRGVLSKEDHVLLVDDLIRSGNTACEAVRSIRCSGAICSQILVLNDAVMKEDCAERLAGSGLQCISCTPVRETASGKK